MPSAFRRPDSVCVYCGSSNLVDPRHLADAESFGKDLAANGMRLVYGGGGVGLMGAVARAAHDAGGRVLGIMPEFLRSREILYDEVETIIVPNMHERKMIMFQESDAFVVLPGGIGTLEEIVELLSWRRLTCTPSRWCSPISTVSGTRFSSCSSIRSRPSSRPRTSARLGCRLTRSRRSCWR